MIDKKNYQDVGRVSFSIVFFTVITLVFHRLGEIGVEMGNTYLMKYLFLIPIILWMFYLIEDSGVVK